jgi:NAD(P)-dependent dehydrogenase (short-subunit alcohol dehydrogenase family)
LLHPKPALSPDDVATCRRVLQAIAADRTLLADVEPGERRELLMAAGVVSRPARSELKNLAKVLRRQRRAAERAHDAAILAATAMRVERRSSEHHPTPLRLDASRPVTEEELQRPRDCYICKQPYRRLHHFYHSMCPACAELNYAKRSQTARLDGRVAVVTGARIKIGFHSALMLLRAGATVVATTRFPRDAARRYAEQPDFADWKDRLHVYGLDLRHVPSVELFAHHLGHTLGRLDLLLNNAAQTVRRPPAFYTHLLELEERPPSALAPSLAPLLEGHHTLCAQLGALGGRALGAGDAGLVRFQGGAHAIGIVSSARLSQVPCAPEDTVYGDELFPPGHIDGDDQQIDLRPVNSWRLRLGEVSTPELLEVHLVNAVAPFILNSRLRALMTRDRTNEKHIVNVSAMEAQFSRNKKTDKHPHTNMAKAALNMMTRTSAPDYASDGIFMNSVDTGWVTDEDPLIHVARKQAIHEFHPPLDAIDGAARVCDPIFSGLITGRHMWGLFLKDYQPVNW